MSHEGIFVPVNGEIVPVEGIMQDSGGMYYLGLGYWICTHGHPNPPWRLKCLVPGCPG